MGTVRKITPKQDVDLWDQFCSEALGDEYVKPEPYVIPLNPPIEVPIPESIEERIDLQERIEAVMEAAENSEDKVTLVDSMKLVLGVMIEGEDIDRLWDAVKGKPQQVFEKIFNDVMERISPKKPGVGGDDVPGGSVGSSD
ncbi:hypothetical protein 7S3_13 [uncultured Caudovirales phage]|uniref:Uncharacterized protein n=1 Tax=uncultured Caudovirales phage TaxID=2100421 RepID=A0A2H4JAU7_9CAUD|nr:hypothetical protein 7S3_13 [uncultured Caudovirales phage]